MKKTKSAVRYGIERLKLSPDELFKLIESSQGYDGEDYSRWLAGKIIEVAEEDGVQFSQLLVKKFNIINSIIEEVSESGTIKEEFLDIFKSILCKKIYSVNFEGVGEPLDVDWFTGLDLDSENSFFVKEKLPEDLRDKLLDNEEVSIILKLSLESPNKKTDLFSEAKNQLLNIQSEGALMLYRLCSIARAFNISKAKFGILTPVKFLYDSENRDIINEVLSFYNIEEGFSIKSVEMSSDAFNSGDMAFLTLRMKEEGSEEQDGIVLTAITLDDESLNGYEELDTKRYSKSSQPMLNKIASSTLENCDNVPSLSNGEVHGFTKGIKDALGYLNINGKVSLSTLPEEGKKCIAITESNIKDIIAYYGVTVAREQEWGYTSDIPCLIDGGVGYDELLYNCLPLFLFDYNVNFKNHGELKLDDGSTYSFNNRLDVETSDTIKGLLDVGVPYFSFEAKELFNICKDYIEYTKENIGIRGKSFRELRELSDNADFNNMYEEKLLKLRDFINNLSKKFM